METENTRPRELARRFGQGLRDARYAAGLTESQLARLAGIDVHYVQEMERGDVIPTSDMLRILARQYALLDFDLLDWFIEALHEDAQGSGEVRELRPAYGGALHPDDGEDDFVPADPAPVQRLREARTAAGLTLQQMAELTGVTAEHLEWMEESLMMPTATFIAEVCRILQLTPADLVDSATWALVQHQQAYGKNP